MAALFGERREVNFCLAIHSRFQIRVAFITGGICAMR
jgi:hypothetical protein